MSEDSNNDDSLIGTFSKAMATGDPELVKAALAKATEQSQHAHRSAMYLIREFPDIAQAYYEQTDVMPSLHHADKSAGETAIIAEYVGLGTKTPYNYTGDRSTGRGSKTAVKTSIQFIEQLRARSPYALAGVNGVSDSLLASLLGKVDALPELSDNTINSWVSAIADSVMLWEGISNVSLSDDGLIGFATYSGALLRLKNGSRAYAEARLDSLKDKKLKSLKRKYDGYDQVDALYKEGEPLFGKEHVHLSNYQHKRDSINGMQLDASHWEYAISKLVTEKLSRLLR